MAPIINKPVDFAKIDAKWQKRWEQKKAFEVNEKGKKKKFYVLEMYPYPSGSGLHMGHAFNYTIGDVFSRFKKLQGFNVLHPAGYDSFGLPAENAAIKANSHPRIFTDQAIVNFMKQQKALGLTYDWTRKLSSHDPEYYRWNQKFFLEFLKNGLVYRKKSPVNWCPKCSTVLANEQVHNGKCWRHGDTDVIIKPLEQWFIKTTKYADELLDCVDKLDWPDRIKIMQKNWIGRSEGAEIQFKVGKESWPVFTTRADTLMGVTFLVVSAQHPQLMTLVTGNQEEEVKNFLKKIKSTSEKDAINLEKEGVFTGSYAEHPITKEKVPIWTGNFVVADYGSGMVMAVPAHDQRDFDFAKKYAIPIKQVITSKDGKTDVSIKAYTQYGKLINSGEFDGLESNEAKIKIVEALSKKKIAKQVVQFKLRDWLVSRQRYWGTPIPVVYCDKCGCVPLPEKELPVLLPEDIKFGEGNPLETSKNFVEAKCPTCKGKARRETDTMDTFFDSSWYYLRFTDSQNKKESFAKEKAEYWMPVDFYTGGAEHACMHLIYARFFTKALRDLGYLKVDEPFTRLFNQGMIHGEDGFVMAKSRGNVIDPLSITGKYGADALRFFLVSVASPDKDFDWSVTSFEGSHRFIQRVYNHSKEIKFVKKPSAKLEHKLHLTIKDLSNSIEKVQYNLAVIQLRELFKVIEEEGTNKESYESFLKMLSPFCPHIAEEIWETMGNKEFISLSDWPELNEKKIDESFEKQEKAVEQLSKDITNLINLVKEKSGTIVEKAYVYTIPNEKEIYSAEALQKKAGVPVKVFAVNDKEKYDPQNKSQKAKPGKPGIYLE